MNFIKVIFFFLGLAAGFSGYSQSVTRSTFDFYNDAVEISLDQSVFNNFCSQPTEKNINNWYNTINNSHYEDIISKLSDYKRSHNLDDWFYYQLVRKVAERLSPKEQNYELYTLYKWFLMGKSGYDVTLTYAGNNLLFYIRSDENIYDIPFFTQNGIQYVCLNYHDYGKIDFTRQQPQGIKLKIAPDGHGFSYKITRVPDFRTDLYAEKKIEFSYHQETYQFNIKVNPLVQNIFRNYPVVDFDSYFNIPLSKETYTTLIPLLKAQLKHKNVYEGVDYLMHFTRYAFSYANDQENFGKERRLSPEQTLLSGQSDCDDRAALFFYLVKEIYDLPMIALLYPSHVTIAVKFDKKIGKPVVYKGEKYYICEPTPQYTDLQLGQTSSALRKQTFQVVFEYAPSK